MSKAVELFQADVKAMRNQILLREQGIERVLGEIEKAKAEIQQLTQDIANREAAIAELTTTPAG